MRPCLQQKARCGRHHNKGLSIHLQSPQLFRSTDIEGAMLNIYCRSSRPIHIVHPVKSVYFEAGSQPQQARQITVRWGTTCAKKWDSPLWMWTSRHLQGGPYLSACALTQMNDPHLKDTNSFNLVLEACDPLFQLCRHWSHCSFNCKIQLGQLMGEWDGWQLDAPQCGTDKHRTAKGMWRPLFLFKEDQSCAPFAWQYCDAPQMANTTGPSCKKAHENRLPSPHQLHPDKQDELMSVCHADVVIYDLVRSYLLASHRRTDSSNRRDSERERGESGSTYLLLMMIGHMSISCLLNLLIARSSAWPSVGFCGSQATNRWPAGGTIEASIPACACAVCSSIVVL